MRKAARTCFFVVGMVFIFGVSALSFTTNSRGLENAQPIPQFRLAQHRWALADASAAAPGLAREQKELAQARSESGWLLRAFRRAAGRPEASRRADAVKIVIDQDIDSPLARWAKAHPGQTTDLGLAGRWAGAGDGTYDWGDGALDEVRKAHGASALVIADPTLEKHAAGHGEARGVINALSWIVAGLSFTSITAMFGGAIGRRISRAADAFGDMLERGHALAKAGNKRAWAVWAGHSALQIALLWAVGVAGGLAIGRPAADVAAARSNWLAGAPAAWAPETAPSGWIQAEWALGPAAAPSAALSAGAPSAAAGRASAGPALSALSATTAVAAEAPEEAPAPNDPPPAQIWRKENGSWRPATAFEAATWGVRADPWIQAIAPLRATPQLWAQMAQLSGQTKTIRLLFCFYFGAMSAVAWLAWRSRKTARAIASGKAAQVIGTPAWEEVQRGLGRAQQERKELVAELARAKAAEQSRAQANSGAAAGVEPISAPPKRTARRL